MNLQDTVLVNRKIMHLIKSKYDELFPSGYNNYDANYFKRLKRDTTQAEDALQHGGLALPPDDE